jgi:hypothetical protein
MNFISDYFGGRNYEDLMDLLSVCNISLLFEIEEGIYCYIHGRNPFGTGEGSLDMIYKKLDLESKK